jgi:hypothetical protein
MFLLAPGWFLHELELFDPSLRCRWSERTNMFQLERKITHSIPINTSVNDTEHDDYVRAREGYILVGVISPDGFNRSIFEKLKASDLWANGGWEAMADMIEAYEESEEKRNNEAFEREIRETSRELYHLLKMRQGSSIYNVGY